MRSGDSYNAEKAKKRCFCVGPPKKKKEWKKSICSWVSSMLSLLFECAHTHNYKHRVARTCVSVNYILTSDSESKRNVFFFPFPLEWGGACFVNVLEFFFITMAAEKWVLMVTAQTPTNIAVIKYWGKRDETLILPVNDSISVTLDPDHLCTTTTVAVSPSFDQDRMWLNGKV